MRGGGVRAKWRWCARKVGWCAASGYPNKCTARSYRGYFAKYQDRTQPCEAPWYERPRTLSIDPDTVQGRAFEFLDQRQLFGIGTESYVATGSDLSSVVIN